VTSRLGPGKSLAFCYRVKNKKFSPPWKLFGYSDIPAGDGEIANLFYSVRSLQAVKGLFLVDMSAKEFNLCSLLYFCSLVFLDFLENRNKLVFFKLQSNKFLLDMETCRKFESFLVFLTEI
jgi:hypothetical protein